MNHKDLETLYSNINSRITPVAQEELNGSTTYCKAIWTLGEWEKGAGFYDLMRAAAPLADKGALFDTQGTPGQLHWTLFQLKTFPQIITTETLENDALTLKRILYEMPNFCLEFRGISKTKFGLFLNGYPSVNVNAIRDKIRSEFAEIVEPHPQDICHATLFRFTQEPSVGDHALLDRLVENFRNINLARMVPSEWEVGYGTWLQKINTSVSFDAAPRWILHRGLKDGPAPELENVESILWERLAEGWDVEVDIWLYDGLFWLGHDRPTHILKNSGLLTHPRVWVHCKNLEAVSAMPVDSHYFVHDNDPATISSKGYVWCYPGNLVEKKPTVVVLPERVGFKFPLLHKATAVCSDYLPNYFLE